MRKIKPIAPDAFCFDGEFGSAGTALVPLEAENSFCVRLGLAPTGGGGRWTNRFQCVIKTGARGNSLHLELHRPSESLAWFNEYIVSYSYDRRNWHPVPYRSGERGLTVDYLDFPEFEEDRVYIGGQIPYTAEILEEQIAQWTRQSSVVVHVIGQSMEGRPLYRLTVGTETPGGPAHYVANHHPGEGMACWRIVGMIEWLIGPHGEEARREQCFHFMPLSCPDGPAHGWSRCNAAGIDMNRSYRAEGSRAEEQALEVFSCQRDIEGLMRSPQRLTSAWLMHTWGGLVEPLILPGKGLIGSGGWEAFAAA